MTITENNVLFPRVLNSGTGARASANYSPQPRLRVAHAALVLADCPHTDAAPRILSRCDPHAFSATLASHERACG
jgi:hypothetical protein